MIVENDQEVGLKMRGLPWRVTDEEVHEFFKDFKIHQDSFLYGIGEDDRKNGFGAILFEDEDEAAKAMDALQRQYIGQRFIILYPLNYGRWKSFPEE
jgi:RNA recognition motif-containing protein